MKKHAIIPIFIPHRGCPHNCVFCNQNAITARSSDITPEDARRIIEEYLPTLTGRGLEEIEVSFFGGSFTGIPIEEQSAFLALAKEYKDAGKIDKLHLSTRPDYIDRKILDNLKAYSVDVIELGVQSFDEKVLKASARGHGEAAVYEAGKLIKEYGFTLGIQLMIGLPGDSYEACMESVRKTIGIAPEIARLYPTVVITDTPLYEMYRRGDYMPWSQDEMLRTAKDMYVSLTDAGINVIRVGLKSSALINEEAESCVAGNSYHPAFCELMQSEIFKDKIEAALKMHFGEEKLLSFRVCEENQILNDDAELEPALYTNTKAIATAELHINPASMSQAAGHKASNRAYFRAQYPRLILKLIKDDSVSEGKLYIK